MNDYVNTITNILVTCIFQMFGEVLGPLLFKPAHMKNLVNSITVIVPVSNMPNSVKH
mgnify:FL=1